MIVLYILGGLLAFILLLLLLPIQIEIKYSEQISLRIKYLFIPFQIMPKKEKKAADETEEVKEDEQKGFLGRFFSELWIEVKFRLTLIGRRLYRSYRLARRRIREKLNIKKKKPVSQDIGPQPVKKEKSSFAQLREARGFSGMVALLWRVVSLAGGAFRKVLKGMTVQRFDFTARISGDDAAQTATSYGEWCAVLYPALSFVLGAVRKYKKNIDIAPDFSGGQTRVDVNILLRFLPVTMLVHSAGAFLKLIFLEIKDAVKQKMDEASVEASLNIDKGGAV